MRARERKRQGEMESASQSNTRRSTHNIMIIVTGVDLFKANTQRSKHVLLLLLLLFHTGWDNEPKRMCQSNNQRHTFLVAISHSCCCCFNMNNFFFASSSPLFFHFVWLRECSNERIAYYACAELKTAN